MIHPQVALKRGWSLRSVTDMVAESLDVDALLDDLAPMSESESARTVPAAPVAVRFEVPPPAKTTPVVASCDLGFREELGFELGLPPDEEPFPAHLLALVPADCREAA